MVFVTEWGCYQYTVIPFGIKNAPAIFSRIVVSSIFWTVFGLVRDHIESLCMMLGRCRQYQIMLNSKKCIFCTRFGVLLGHVVCCDGILVDPTKFAIILYLPPPTSITQLISVLGHTGYYRKFIRGYAEITKPMEKILKKDAKFQWIEACQESLDKLKNKMATMPILVFSE